MNLFKVSSIFSICFITACAPVPSTSDFPVENKPALNEAPQTGKVKSSKQANAITSWDLSGAIAAKNSKKGWNASLNWKQHGANQYQIRLFGPLGGGTVIIEKVGSVITFVDGPKKVLSHNADNLLEQQTGVRLPVQNLYYWVRGLAAPGGAPSAQYDANGHLTSLTQAGYKIYYTNYTTVNNVDLPGKIQLQGHDISIKLVVSHWQI